MIMKNAKKFWMFYIVYFISYDGAKSFLKKYIEIDK